MDSIAREAVVERLLPEGSRVYGCIATIQGRRPVSSPVSPPREGSEVVADRLDACFCDQALSGQGWDGLQQEWFSASGHISDAEDLQVWSGGEPREQEARRHLLAAAANLLNISSMVEAMRSGKR